MGFVVGGFGEVNGLAGNSLVLEVIGELGKGMREGGKGVKCVKEEGIGRLLVVGD